MELRGYRAGGIKMDIISKKCFIRYL